MISAIAPVWDGNETWLVLGGGGLMAAFPLAYSILLPALYAPIIAMLLALIFRGVAFEFRHRHERHRRFWTWGFVLGSYVATFAQGIALGTFIQGIAVEGRAYAGGWFDWLTPFSVFTGLALDRRLRAARRVLPHHEDGRRVAGADVPPRAAARRSGSRVDRRRQRVDAIPRSGASPSAGSPGRTSPSSRRCRSSSSAIALGFFRSSRARAAGDALHHGEPAVPRLLLRGRDQRLSLHRAAGGDRVAGGGARTRASASCSSERRCWCRSSSPIPAIRIGCSAARSARRRAITERRAEQQNVSPVVTMPNRRAIGL